MFSLRKATIASTLALLLSPLTPQSAFPTPASSSTIPLYIEEHVLDPKGRKMFHVHFFKSTDGLLEFSSDERQIIKNAFSYWTRILHKSFNGTTPATIWLRKGIGYDADDAAYGTNQKLLDVLSGRLSPDKTKSDGSLEIGKNYYSTHLGPRSHIIPVQRKADLHSLAVHELAHGLFDPEDKDDQRFFDLNTQTFGGPNAHNINEVLEINKPGADLQKIPVDEEGYHIQLAHGLMSHHNFRNWPIFMEAELALLQDVGWTIDRRNFFGYSLYRNGQTIINENGYFARNPEGTAYLVGTYNQQPDGVGLHIYGSHNHVTQKADILTEGTRAVGGRVDGVGNTLVINKDITIHANGSDGIGVLFAYGTGHKFLLNGEIRAEGERGIGLSFDFGANLMGSDTEERGSYWRFLDGKPDQLLPELQGPLAKEVLINGDLVGTQKAIYMSPTGYVEKITITPNSRVKGDIVSEYNRKNSAEEPYLTSLIFGPKNAEHNVEGQKFIYTDNIKGGNIKAQFTGTYTGLYGGQHELYSATVAPGATLAGNSTFKTQSPAGFTNAGILSPSSSEKSSSPKPHIGTMTINGNFRQTDTGKLIIDIASNGQSDLLYVTQKAYLAGLLEIRPEPGFYSNSWKGKITFLKADKGIEGDFEKITSQSPTLQWKFLKTEKTYSSTVTDLASDEKKENITENEVLVTRQPNAYSQYTNNVNNVNEQSVGRVLDRVVDKADQPLQSLYEALDFSAPDGSEVRSALAQLSPVAYGGAFGVSLKREQQISNTLNQRPAGVLAPGQWQAFALPFVSSQTNSKASELQVGANMRTTGLIAGIEHQTSSSPGLTWGFHGVVGNKASLTLNTPDNARGSLQAWGIGTQLRYQPELLTGPYLSAQARIGLEQGNLTRTLAINGYKGQQQAKWQGMTTTASVLGGYLWKVHDNVSLGPLVGFDYTMLTHPQITEKGQEDVRLELKKTRYHSLQSNLGIRGVISLSQKLAVDLQARWDRELLNTTLTQRARFANIPDSAFNTQIRVGPRDALNISGQATYELSPTVTLGARASAQFARSQKPDLIGNLSLNVKF